MQLSYHSFAGPLQWHWQVTANLAPAADARYHESVELSYYELRHAIQAQGFEFLVRIKHSVTHVAAHFYLPPRACCGRGAISDVS